MILPNIPALTADGVLLTRLFVVLVTATAVIVRDPSAAAAALPEESRAPHVAQAPLEEASTFSKILMLRVGHAVKLPPTYISPCKSLDLLQYCKLRVGLSSFQLTYQEKRKT